MSLSNRICRTSFSGFRTKSSDFVYSFWFNLPLDVVKKIIEYEGSIKYRHGRFMNQIPKTDFRYPLLRTIPSKIITSYGTTHVLLSYKDTLIVFDESYIGLKEVIYTVYQMGYEVTKYRYVLK